MQYSCTGVEQLTLMEDREVGSEEIKVTSSTARRPVCCSNNLFLNMNKGKRNILLHSFFLAKAKCVKSEHCDKEQIWRAAAGKIYTETVIDINIDVNVKFLMD